MLSSKDTTQISPWRSQIETEINRVPTPAIIEPVKFYSTHTNRQVPEAITPKVRCRIHQANRQALVPQNSAVFEPKQRVLIPLKSKSLPILNHLETAYPSNYTSERRDNSTKKHKDMRLRVLKKEAQNNAKSSTAMISYRIRKMVDKMTPYDFNSHQMYKDNRTRFTFTNIQFETPYVQMKEVIKPKLTFGGTNSPHVLDRILDSRLT